MAQAARDENRVPTLIGVSGADGSTPLRVEVDATTNGLHVQIVGDDVGIGGGTQYTEDAAAAANPVGNAVNLIRADTPAAVTSTDGDNVAQRGTDYGAAYVQVVDSSGSFIDTFGGGTEYTEDAAAAANPVGGALIVVREDARAGSLTSTDGDNVALRGNNLGELYVKTTDSDALLTTIDTDTSNMATSLAALDNAVDGNYLNTNMNIAGTDVSAGAGVLTAQTQRVTIATDDEVNNLLGTIDADTSIIAGAVSAGQMQVDIVADGAGLALAANQLADGHNVTVDNAAGASAVNIQDGGNAITVDNAGTFVVQVNGDALTALQVIDNMVHTGNVAVTGYGTIGAVFDDTTPGAVTENQTQSLRMSSERYLYTEIRDAAGNERGATVNASGQLNVVDPNTSQISSNTGTSATLLQDIDDILVSVSATGGAATDQLQVDVVGALPAGTNAIGKLAANSGVDIGDVTINGPLGGGAEAGAVLVTIANDSTGVVSVDDNGGALTVDNAGTFAVQSTLQTGSNAIGKLAANSGVDIGDVDVTSAVITGGGVADDGTTPGNPIMIGGKAVETDGTDPTSVSAEDDVAILRTDRNRRLLVNDFHPNLWDVAENHTAAQTNNSLKGAPGASLSLYITDIIVSNGATAGNIKFVEDTAGTPVDLIEVVYLAANGGFVTNFRTPLKVTANKDFGFTSVTVTTHSITVLGFIAP